MPRSAAIAPDTVREVRDTCLCLHVLRAARALSRRYDQALRPAGLNGWQFGLLMSLNRAPAPTIGALAAELAMDRTTLTANLKPLQRDGLVAVEVDPGDARARVLTLTAAGHRALARALPLWRRAQAEAGAALAPESLPALRAALRTLSFPDATPHEVPA